MGQTAPVTGTGTVVLGDVAGSTRLWQHDPDAMTVVSRRLSALADELADAHRGHRPREQGEGDNLVAVFPAASDAVAFALALDAALATEPWPGGLTIGMRLGVHTGDVVFDTSTGYLGPTFNRCARLRDLGHARQVLLSQATRDIVADSLPTGARIEDLGVHQLRDLSRADHVFQLRAPDDDRTYAPLKSVSSLPNNLPVPVDTLVGRETEIAEVTELFGHHRLVTLTGAGGSGKTRLAQHVAAELLSYAPDGAWWVDLMPVTDEGDVARALAEAAGLDDVGDDASLVAALGAKQLLLVVDNCEHVIDAVADTVELLLTRCREVRVLATSREALDIPGEHAVRVRPLDTPAVDAVRTIADLETHDATRLFLERAAANAAPAATDTDVPAIATICRRLDGIPLAIELAAARSRVLPLGEIAASLDDRFAVLGGGRRRRGSRQRTLEASVAWSYDLLEPDEQAMLRRLGVFPGPFDLDAAAAVGAPDGRRAVALDALTSLVDKSLVAVRPAADGRRYRLLETIRQYALDRLHEHDEGEAARDAHLDHVVAACDELYGQVAGRMDTPAGWTDIELWVDDVRAGEQWALHRGRPEAVVRLRRPFTASAVLSSRAREWDAAFSAVLEDERLDAATRAFTEVACAFVRAATGAQVEALRMARRGVATLRDLGKLDAPDTGILPPSIAYVAPLVDGSGLDEAREQYEWASALSEGTRGLYGWLYGTALFLADEFEEGLRVARRSLDAATDRDLRHAQALLLPLVASFESVTGENGAGAATAKRAHAAVREHYPAYLPMAAAGYLFWPLVADPDRSSLRAVVAEADAIGAGPRRTGSWLFATVSRGLLATLDGDLATASAELDRGVAAIRAIEMPFWLAVVLTARAAVHALAGEAEDAMALVTEVRAMLPDSGWSYARNWSQLTATIALDGHPETSLEELHTHLRDLAATGHRFGWMCSALSVAVTQLTDAGHPTEAAFALGAVRPLATQVGSEPTAHALFEIDRAEACVDRTDPAQAAAYEAGSQLPFDDVATAVADALAAVATREGWSWAGDRGDHVADRPVTGWAALTPAEIDVARKVAEGLTNKQVGEALFVSENTVKTHLKSVYAKLEVSSRAELATRVAAVSA